MPETAVDLGLPVLSLAPQLFVRLAFRFGLGDETTLQLFKSIAPLLTAASEGTLFNQRVATAADAESLRDALEESLDVNVSDIGYLSDDMGSTECYYECPDAEPVRNDDADATPVDQRTRERLARRRDGILDLRAIRIRPYALLVERHHDALGEKIGYERLVDLASIITCTLTDDLYFRFPVLERGYSTYFGEVPMTHADLLLFFNFLLLYRCAAAFIKDDELAGRLDRLLAAAVALPPLAEHPEQPGFWLTHGRPASE